MIFQILKSLKSKFNLMSLNQFKASNIIYYNNFTIIILIKKSKIIIYIK